MIIVNVYKNGVLIDGHAHPHVCEMVSKFGWSFEDILRTYGYVEEHYQSTLYDKKSREGLSFFKVTKVNDTTETFIDIFHDQLWVFAKEYPAGVKVIDNRLIEEGIANHARYFIPSKEWYVDYEKQREDEGIALP